MVPLNRRHCNIKASPPPPPIKQDNFADLEEASHASTHTAGAETRFGVREIASPPASSVSSSRPSAASEQVRRSSAAATLGTGPVDGEGRGEGATAASATRKSSSSRDRRRTTEGR